MGKVDWDRLAEHWIDDWRDYYTVALPICGCGSHGPTDLLDECLRYGAMDWPQRDALPADSPWERGFYQSSGHELAAKILDGYGLLEHGTGIGFAWITDDGKRLLALVDAWKAANPEPHD